MYTQYVVFENSALKEYIYESEKKSLGISGIIG